MSHPIEYDTTFNTILQRLVNPGWRKLDRNETSVGDVAQPGQVTEAVAGCGTGAPEDSVSDAQVLLPSFRLRKSEL